MRRSALVWLAALVLVGLAAPAGAAESPREKARLLGKTAGVLARDGKYAEAAALYEQAYALEPDAILLFNLGVVLEKQGELPRARAYLERYLDTERDARLREKGALRLAQVLAALGRLRVEVDVAGAAVAVDGTVRGVSPLPLQEVVAGRHRVTVSRAGYEPVELQVEVPAGVETPVRVSLAPVVEPADAPALAVPAPVPAPTDPGVGQAVAAPLPVVEAGAAPAEPSRPPRFTWGVVAASSGAVLALGGGVLSWLARSDRAAVTDARTVGGVVISPTQARARQLEERANRFTVGSWVLYGAGAAAIVTGVTLLLWPGDASPPTAFVGPLPGGAEAGVRVTF